MEVTVIIPNYNGIQFIDQCLASLKKQCYKNFQIIVIDNGSTDGSLEKIKNDYPEVKCYEFKENTGFCTAVNKGIELANTPYILLLNNDTIVQKYFIERLVKRIKSSPKIFSVSGQMLQMQNKEYIDDAGDYYTILGHAVARGKDKKATGYNQVTEVFSCCAGAAIYRAKILEEIGVFDEQHFAYLEDVDIGYRARIHGYINVYEPSAKVLHFGSGASGSRYNEFKVKLAAENNIYMIYKNMPKYQMVMNSPFLLMGSIMKLLFFMEKGLAKTYLQGVASGIRKCRSRIGQDNKVVYQKKHRKNYIKIQMELIYNFRYLR